MAKAPYLQKSRLIQVIIWSAFLFSPLIKAGTPRFPGLCLQLAALALISITLYLGFKKGMLYVQWTALDILLACFLFISAISSLLSFYKHDAQRSFLFILSFTVFYFHLAEYFTIKDLKRLFWGIMGLGVLEALAGFYQAFFLGESRISGTFLNPNHLAAFLACAFMLLLARILFNPFFRKNFCVKISLLIIMGGALLLTGSRGGLLAIAAGTVTIVSLTRKKKQAACLFILCLILLLIIPNPLTKRLMRVGERDVYAYSRLSMWKSALSMLMDHPSFGVGNGNFRYFSYRYAFPVKGAWARYAKVASYAHNELLHLGAEMGIPGIILFIMALWFIIEDVFKKAAPSGSEQKRSFGNENYGDQKALFVSLIALIVHSMVDFIFHIPPLIFMLIILVVWIRNTNISPEEGNGVLLDLSGKVRRLIILMSFLIPVFLSYILIEQYIGYLIFNKAGGKDLITDVKYIEKAVEMDFGCAPYHNSLGGAYFKLYGITKDPSQLNRGINEAQLAQRLNPEDFRFPMSLGEGFLNLYQMLPERKDILERAAHEFRKCQSLAPYHYQGFLGLGRVFLYQKREKAAITALEKAVSLEPYSIYGHYLLGLSYNALGDRKSAHSEYEKVKEIKNIGLEKVVRNPYERGLVDFNIDISDPNFYNNF